MFESTEKQKWPRFAQDGAVSASGGVRWKKRRRDVRVFTGDRRRRGRASVFESTDETKVITTHTCFGDCAAAPSVSFCAAIWSRFLWPGSSTPSVSRSASARGSQETRVMTSVSDGASLCGRVVNTRLMGDLMSPWKQESVANDSPSRFCRESTWSYLRARQ